MRIILKPSGLACIVGAILVPTGLLILRKPVEFKDAGAKVKAATPGSVQSQPAAQPVLAESSGKTPLTPGILLAPDIVSDEWQPLIGQAPDGVTHAKASLKVVSASVPGHPFARQIKVTHLGTQPWEMQLAHPLNVALKQGRRIKLSYWARSKDYCPVTAVVEQSAEPYAKVVYKVNALTPKWQKFTEEWVQASDTPDNWAKMDFHLGHKTGEIELTGVIIREEE